MTPQASQTTPAASGVEPRTTPQENGHKNGEPRDHPQGERSNKRPNAETGVDESGRISSPSTGGASDSDEDSRARRRDLGP